MIIKRRLPENFAKTDYDWFSHFLSIDIPPSSFKVHRNALLLKNGILVTLLGIKKQSLLYDSRLKEIGGALLIWKMIAHSLLKFNRIAIIGNSTPVATVINEWSNNYYHWFTEVLPRITFLASKIGSFSLLLPSTSKESYQLASLQLMNVPIRYFKELAILSKVYLPDRQAPSPAHYNPDLLRSFVIEFQQKILLNVSQGERIYISRRNASVRRVINEEEVVKVLSRFNFKVVEFEHFNLKEQVSISYHARLVVGIHGAGLTNMMFCKPGAHVLELSLENQVRDKCYFTLADACNLKYYYQFCKSSTNSDDYHTSDLVVDVKALEHNLNVIIANAA